MNRPVCTRACGPRSHRVRVGGASKAELLARLSEAGVRLNPLAEALFADQGFATTAESSVVDLQVCTVAELGFGRGATFAQLAGQASSLGLAMCPLEVAPHLRLQFTEQAEGQVGQVETRHQAPPGSLTVASLPPADEENRPWGFYLRRMEGRLWLRGFRSWSGHLWSPADTLVFVRAESAA